MKERVLIVIACWDAVLSIAGSISPALSVQSVSILQPLIREIVQPSILIVSVSIQGVVIRKLVIDCTGATLAVISVAIKDEVNANASGILRRLRDDTIISIMIEREKDLRKKLLNMMVV